jgi:hypothetical protein
MSWWKRNVFGTSRWMDGWMMVMRIYIDGRKTIFDTLNCESGPVFATIGEYLDYTDMDVVPRVGFGYVRGPIGTDVIGTNGCSIFLRRSVLRNQCLCGMELCIGGLNIRSRL